MNREAAAAQRDREWWQKLVGERNTVTITYTDEDDLCTKLRAVLRAHEEWVTPKTLRERYNLSSNALYKRLSQWRRVGVLVMDDPESVNLTAGGRIRMLRLTPMLREKMDAIRPHNRRSAR